MTRRDDTGPSELDLAMREAARRLNHEEFVAAQADFLDDAAQRWRQVRELRAFLRAIGRRFGGTRTPELKQWLAWVKALCDGLDPLSKPGLNKLQEYAAALRPPPDLGRPDPDEQLWRDMAWLDKYLEDEADNRDPAADREADQTSP